MSYKRELFTKYKWYVFFAILLFCFGVILFFVKRSWLIVYWVPTYSRSENASIQLRQKISPRKIITRWYWRDEQLRSEQTSFVLRTNTAENLRLVLGTWISLLYEERILERMVEVESVALEPLETLAYLSFDQHFLKREWSIRKKWQILDGLCRTIADSNFGIQNIVFLVGHQPMLDDHLDFSRPWPIDGFT